MGNPEAEQKAASRLVVQFLLSAGGGLGLPQVNVDHPGGQHQRGSVIEKQGGVGERIAAKRIRDPQGPVAQFLDSLGEFDGLGGREAVCTGPNPDGADIHGHGVKVAARRWR